MPVFCPAPPAKVVVGTGQDGCRSSLDRIHDHKINRLDELLPWNWVPLATAMENQAA